MNKIFKFLGFGFLALSFVVGFGVRSAFAAAPLLTAVAHDETAKTITLTYDQAVHYTTEHGNVTTAVSPAILNIFPATWNSGTSSWDFGPSGPSTVAAMSAAVAQNATITSASFNGANTILTITYSGTLRQTAYTHYVVDSWVAESAPGLDDGGYDLKNAGAEALVDAGTAISAFTVTGNDSVHPTLKAVIHNENTNTKTITLLFDKPVELTTEAGDILVTAGNIKNALGVFVSSTSPTATDKSGTYDLTTLAGGVTITGAAFNGGGNSGTILTVTYTGTLTGGLYYVVDSWNNSGGWDIKDVAGNTYDAVSTGAGVSHVFTAGADSTDPTLTAVAHDATAKTITLTYNKPIHFETEHGNVVTAISPSILNIFEAVWAEQTDHSFDWNWDLSTVAPGATITSAVFDGDTTLNSGTVLKVTYSGTLVGSTLKHYLVDSWVASSGYDVKDVSGNTDVAGADPTFAVEAAAGSSHNGSGGGGNPPVTLPVLGDHPEGCSGGNLFNTATGKACINNAAPQGCSGGNLFNISTGAACVNNLGGNNGNGNGNQGLGGHGPYNFGTVTLKNGSKGAAVMELQRFLNAKLNLGLVVDGKLGPKTIAVIKKWQLDNGLVSDGLIGAKTKAKMNASVQ